jgi:hypothetical protein
MFVWIDFSISPRHTVQSPLVKAHQLPSVSDPTANGNSEIVVCRRVTCSRPPTQGCIHGRSSVATDCTPGSHSSSSTCKTNSFPLMDRGNLCGRLIVLLCYHVSIWQVWKHHDVPYEGDWVGVRALSVWLAGRVRWTRRNGTTYRQVLWHGEIPIQHHW